MWPRTDAIIRLGATSNLIIIQKQMKRKLPLAITTALALPALAAVLPFSETFESGLGEFSVEDANNDGITVKTAGYSGVNYSNCIQYPGSAESSADDWLFTPAFNLKKGYTYTLTYQYKVSSSNTIHKVEWKAGAKASSDEMTIGIAPEKEFTYDWGSWGKESVAFTVPEDGEYYLGMHLLSDAAQGIIYFDNIEVSDGINSLAPMSPEVADAKFSIEGDALITSFDITLPLQTNGGEALDSDAEIEVIAGRDDDENIGSVKGKPGEVVTFIDQDAPQQWATYHFHCVYEDAESPKVDMDAIPRFGNPKNVEHFIVEQNGNEFSLSWDAVTEAANAGDLLIPSQVRYLVKCNGETVAENTSELSATYTYPLPEEGQEPVSFTIVADAGGKQSGIVTSENIMVGNPYSGEFRESFANRAFSNKTWVIENNKGWSTSLGSSYSPVVNPQDEDGGCLEFAFSGTQRIWSPVLDLSELVNPKVKFYAYLQPSSYYATSVQPAFLVNGEEIALGETINLASGTEGWTEFLLDVPEEALKGNCQLMFTGTGTSSYSGKFFIDNITILSYLEHNLAVEVSAPVKALEIGQKVMFPVVVENKGVNAENEYTLTLLVNGEKTAEIVGPEVNPMEKAQAQLPFTVLPKYVGTDIEFNIIANLNNDGDASDNETSLTLPVNENELERVPSLNASLSEDGSKVTLNWEAPEVSTEPTYTEITESFEDWEAGAIEGANGWIFLDMDNVPQYGINNVNQGANFAAMVAENYTPSNSWETPFNSYDGDKCIVMTASSAYAEVDNIIISPEVKGGTDVKFYTMVFSSYGNGNPETFTVLWSEGGVEPDDFTELEVMVSPRNEWSEKEFTLPANARRFAIRITGKPANPVMFDSFTFTTSSSPAVHTGFNVYRDHEFIATYPSETLSHVDASPVQGAEHTYHITALFDKGESHYSESATVKIKNTQTGIEEIVSDESNVEFFTLQGLRLTNPTPGEIVIVRKGKKTFKAVVK